MVADGIDNIDEKLDYYIGENKRLEAELAEWGKEISKEMPPDFKDWWENSKDEWPLVTRIVLEMRRKNADEAWQEVDILRAKCERLVEAAENYLHVTDNINANRLKAAIEPFKE